MLPSDGRSGGRQRSAEDAESEGWGVVLDEQAEIALIQPTEREYGTPL